MAEVTVSFPRAKTHSEEEAGDVLKAGARPGAASGDAGSSTAATALARRRPHVGARSPQRPGSGSRPPFLSACQPACPACFLPLSFCLFFWFILYFFFPPLQSLCREREGLQAAEGMGGGLGAPLIRLQSDGCSPLRHSRLQRSHFLPSLGSLFLPTKAERMDGSLPAAAVPWTASWSCCRGAAEC